MKTVEVLKRVSKDRLPGYPKIIFSNLFKRVRDNFYLEFVLEDQHYLYSSSHLLIRGEAHPRLEELVEQSRAFLDALKDFILASLFVYSAIIEENSYYLSSSSNVLICRITHARDAKFDLRFYSHNKGEILSFYHDKIYIGRDFIDLENFYRENLGLSVRFQSLLHQEKKIQERAKSKLKALKNYRKPFLNEITYLTNELVKEALERIEICNGNQLSDLKKSRLNDILDSIIYIQNLMLELRDFLSEFARELRKDGETQFVKYITKFSKDVSDDIRYLRKLSAQIHLKISNYKI